MFLDCVAMPYQEHAKERFFKYTSASTALKILESSAVRYSSPLLFNDPFDVQSGLHFEFEIESLPEKIFQRIEQLVASDREPEPQEGNILGAVSSSKCNGWLMTQLRIDFQGRRKVETFSRAR
ncbi:MAG: hypothetical protein SGJ26_19965, partial [Nitrospirota bacterium]|nr:hypothetical protein [Nitrospirota bacterium]